MPFLTSFDYTVKNPVVYRSLNPPTKKEVEEVKAVLAHLSPLFNEGDITLGGSIAIQLLRPEFYRRPRNINLNVPVSKLHNLDELEILLNSEENRDPARRYKLVSRGWSIPYKKEKRETYEEVKFDSSGKPIKRYPHLRLVRFDRESPFSTKITPVRNRHLADYIDIHAFEIRTVEFSERIERYKVFTEKNENGLYIPEQPKPIKFTLPSGEQITLESSESLERVKIWSISNGKKVEERKIEWTDLGHIYENMGIPIEERPKKIASFIQDANKVVQNVPATLEELAQLWNCNPDILKKSFNS